MLKNVSIIVLLITVIACAKNQEIVIEIPSVDKPYSRVVKPPKYTSKINYSVSGFVNDTFLLDSIKIAPGLINWKSDVQEYYPDPPIRVSYIPYRADSGSLRLTYIFYE